MNYGLQIALVYSIWAFNASNVVEKPVLFMTKPVFMAKWLALYQGCNQTAPKRQYKWCNVERTTLYDKNYKSRFDAEIDQGALRGQIKMKPKTNIVRRSSLTWFQNGKIKKKHDKQLTCTFLLI